MSASKDVVFQITATRYINWNGCMTWGVIISGTGSGLLTFTEPQYAAFKSLLMPNSHADFILEEFDEEGKRI